MTSDHNKLLRHIIFAGVFAILILLTGCQKKINKDIDPLEAIDTTALVSPYILKNADLQMNWQADLPLDRNEKIDRLLVFGEHLYVLTTNNYLFCLNRDRGTIRCELQIAAPGIPVCQPYYYKEKLIFIIGRSLIVLDPDICSAEDQRQLENIGPRAVCGAVRNRSNFFVVGADKRLHVIKAEDFTKVFAITADNDSQITSLIVDDRILMFATIAGNVVSVSPAAGQKRWQRDVNGKISAPIARGPGALYVGTEDAKLFKIDIFSGKSLWRAPFQTGQAITTAAVVGNNAIYQATADKGLYAIDSEVGGAIWNIDDGLGLIAERGSKAYVLTNSGKMIVVDNDSGKILQQVDFSDVSKFAINTIDSNLYVADQGGRVAAIVSKSEE